MLNNILKNNFLMTPYNFRRKSWFQ